MLQKLMKRIQRNKEYLFVIMIFLPDYLFFLAVTISAIVLLVRLIKGKIKINSPVSRILFIFGGYLALMALINRNWLGLVATLFVFFVILYWLNLSTFMTPARYMKLQFAIATCSIISFIFIFINYRIPYISSTLQNLFSSYTGVPYTPYFFGLQDRVFSTFDNANYYAFILMIVILVCFNQIQFQLTFRNRALTIYYSFILLLNLIALYLTDTRTVIVALAAGMIVIMIVQRKWRQLRILCLIALVITVAIIIYPNFMPRFSDLTLGFGIRNEIWNNALSIFYSNPFFGKGLFTYNLESKLLGLHAEMHAHSLYLEPLISFGLIGLSIFFSAFFIQFRKVRRFASYLDYPLAAALIVATLIYGVFDIPLLGLQTSLLFFAVLSLPLRKQLLITQKA